MDNLDKSIFCGSNQNKDLSESRPPNPRKMVQAANFQLQSTGPVSSLWIKWILKAAILLCTCIRPCPPFSLGRYKTDLGTQCILSQKKSIKIDCSLGRRSRGGSTQINECQRADPIRLWMINIHPLYDILGSKNFHLTRRPLTFSIIATKLFCINI